LPEAPVWWSIARGNPLSSTAPCDPTPAAGTQPHPIPERLPLPRRSRRQMGEIREPRVQGVAHQQPHQAGARRFASTAHRGCGLPPSPSPLRCVPSAAETGESTASTSPSRAGTCSLCSGNA